MGKIRDALDAANRGILTRAMPARVDTRIRFLTKRLGSTRAVADALGVTPRTVQRYLKGDRRHPPAAVAARIEAEVAHRWQPRVRAREQAAAAARGITVETRASFGFASSAGSTDDPRLRRLTETMPEGIALSLFDAHRAGAGERDLERILAEGLGDAYFRTGPGRSAGLDVQLTNIDYIDMDYGV